MSLQQQNFVQPSCSHHWKGKIKQMRWLLMACSKVGFMNNHQMIQLFSERRAHGWSKCLWEAACHFEDDFWPSEWYWWQRVIWGQQSSHRWGAWLNDDVNRGYPPRGCLAGDVPRSPQETPWSRILHTASDFADCCEDDYEPSGSTKDG